MEPIYRQKIQIPSIATDCYDRLKTSMLLAYIQEVSGAHCTALGVGNPENAGRRLFWAVSRHRVQITRLPKAHETISMETWPCPTSRVAFPRSTVACDAAGEELFRSISLWILMDAETRTMVLPGRSGVNVQGLLTGNELTVPGSMAPSNMERSTRRSVNFTDLDVNGHMNNTQHLNWVDDLLPSSFHREHPAKEFVICYLNEAREGQTVEMNWRLDRDLQVDAHWQDPEDPGKFHRIFSARVLY